MSANQDPYKYFRIEARDIVQQLEQGVLSMEKGVAAADAVPKLLRLAHTLKGAARVVKQREIAELAHAAEETLVPIRDSRQTVGSETTSRVMEQIDGIRSLLDAIDAPIEPAPAERPQQASGDEFFRTIRMDIGELDVLLGGIVETSVQFESMRRAFDHTKRARGLIDLMLAQLTSPRHREFHPLAGAESAARIQSLAEELRTSVIMLERLANRSADQIDRELQQVRQRAEQLRLMPASTLFPSLERTARDTAQALGKQVRLETRGGDARLDAHVLGSIHGALVQIVRNSVAHGIELADKRKKLGKPTAGSLVINVLRKGSRIAFRCQDDGCGIDIDAVRKAAQGKGLLSDGIQNLSVQDVVEMLLRGGISTASAVSEVSGRGIGLDVVSDAVQKLGADVSVQTERNVGTTFEIVVPVSLASLDAIVVEAAGAMAAIPIDAVASALFVRQDEIAATGGNYSILYEGSAIPFLPLAKLLRRKSPAGRTGTWSALVLRNDSKLAAIGVDRLVSISNVVLRPFPALVPFDAVAAGASLDIEGNPRVVLDAGEIVQSAHHSSAQMAERDERIRLPILVIDDSLTTRMLEQSILESAGYQVDLAVSGEQALEKARLKSYALFLVDVEMPGMDGFTFIERTRQDPLLGSTPSILVTSRSSADDKMRGVSVGASAFVVKSEFNQTELLRTIQQLIEGAA